MAHVIQVGAGSGGMVVLDLIARDPRVTEITLIEPDVYDSDNVERHYFGYDSAGTPKINLAADWLQELRPDLLIDRFPDNLAAFAKDSANDLIVATADFGICAVDNEPAKYEWDALMRKHRKPWTLGEVLSGGIGGFVHCFEPDGPCYGCVASFLQRSMEVEKPKTPDYSQPGGAIEEARIPASKAAINVIAGLHALRTLELLDKPENSAIPFTSMLFTLQQVPDVFPEAFQTHRFRIPRSAECLICRPAPELPEDLDGALDQALARLGHA